METYLHLKLHKIKTLKAKINQIKVLLVIILINRINPHSHLLITKIYFPQTNFLTVCKVKIVSLILNFNLKYNLVSFQDNYQTISNNRIILHFLKISHKLTFKALIKIKILEDNLVNLETYNKTMGCLKIKISLLRIIIKISVFKNQWICKRTHFKGQVLEKQENENWF